ncbi:MAG: DUF262 domain-containing protein [Chthonomonadales bacterium]|nr:DUF262 domain-containing protein [Chthonomonadales bacterium]
MSDAAQTSRKADGDGRTVQELLANRKYTIDYFQREYRWEQKHVFDLLNDLSATFLRSYRDDQERTEVETYGYYFLGTVIISDQEGRKSIIDGQQRLTTLTLLLVFLYHQLDDIEQRGQVAALICSLKHGKRTFNLDIPERTACMEALFKGGELPDSNGSESVVNMMARYADIEELFPNELKGPAVPYFVDWLMDNVCLVEITAYSDGDAYTIFETMNDRGLSLTPADMLKGYLLAKITDVDKRTSAGRVWRSRVKDLHEIGKDEDADAIKAWLRSQYADSIRRHKQGAVPEDFDLIGTEFHRWVRNHEKRLRLSASAEFARFIERDFVFYSRWYERLRRAAETLTPGLEAVYYNGQHRFTLQYPLLLAPLCLTDDETTALRKVRVVASYLDVYIYRRVWNCRSINYDTVQYAMFTLMREIRRRALDELVDFLRKRLDDETETFVSNDRFSLNWYTGPMVHRFLARLTDYVETQSGQVSHYVELCQRGIGGYEIEHIWADHPERHTAEFSHPSDFKEYRNRIGGLLLLPKRFNASYGDLPYADKRVHYLSQNLLARSLHEQCYEHNPGFRSFLSKSRLPFRSHAQFLKADLDARQDLYCRLAEQVWSADRLTDAAE